MKNITRKFALSNPVFFALLLLCLMVTPGIAAETELIKTDNFEQATGKEATDEKSTDEKSSDKNVTDGARSNCKQCIKYTGWRGEFDFGLGYLTDDSLRFGDYRGTEKKGAYAAVDGDLHFRDLDGRYLDLYASDLGLDSRQIEVRGGNQGYYELRFGWSEIPRYKGFGTATPFMGVGGDTLTLPADWVYAATTDGMTALDSSLKAISLKTKRKTLDAGATVKFARNWSYKIDYQRQKKTGSRTMGAGLLFNNASILPTPVDFTTDQIDMSLMWAGKRAQVQVGFYGSYFDNGDNSLTWRNPFLSNPQHSAFRAALEPDNDFYQFNLSGAFAITPGIRMSGQAAIGRMTQDDAFLPVTINPVYSDIPLPRASLDGKVDTSTYNLAGKLSARLNRKLSFTARAKWDERKNKTPVDNYMQVVTDLLPTIERYNRPYSYKRQKYSADLRYRFTRTIKLAGGARQENMDRTLQAVERTKETTWWGEARLNVLTSSQFRVVYENSDRDISDYLQPQDGGSIDHPLMRKFNMADRQRDRVRLELDVTPIAALGVNLSYIYANADYDNSNIGLQKSKDQNFTFSVNYAAGTKVTLYAYLSYDDINADILNTTGGSAVPWNAKTRDRIDTAGIGISGRISEKSSIGFDYISSKSKGDIRVQTTQNEDPFDPLRTNLKNAKLHFDHEVNDHWGYKIFAEYEKFSSADWAIDGVGVDGISSVLTMGEHSPKYNVWYFRVQASYRF